MSVCLRLCGYFRMKWWRVLVCPVRILRIKMIDLWWSHRDFLSNIHIIHVMSCLCDQLTGICVSGRMGEAVKPLTKGKLSAYAGPVEQLFSPAHVTMSFSQKNEIRETIVRDKVLWFVYMNYWTLHRRTLLSCIDNSIPVERNCLFFSRSYCYTVWSAIGISLLSVRPSVRLSVRLSACLWRCALWLSGSV